MIAISVGQTMTKYMDALLDPIFECGLSDMMTQALVDMAHYIPPAKQAIQEKLLNLLSIVLSGKTFTQLGGPDPRNGSSNISRGTQDDPTRTENVTDIALALKTLGSFDFSGIEISRVDDVLYITQIDPKLGYILNDFVHDIAINYVDNDSPQVRKAAALTCCQLVVKDPIIHQVSRHATSIVGYILERLLAVAVADPGQTLALGMPSLILM